MELNLPDGWDRTRVAQLFSEVSDRSFELELHLERVALKSNEIDESVQPFFKFIDSLVEELVSSEEKEYPGNLSAFPEINSFLVCQTAELVQNLTSVYSREHGVDLTVSGENAHSLWIESIFRIHETLSVFKDESLHSVEFHQQILLFKNLVSQLGSQLYRERAYVSSNLGIEMPSMDKERRNRKRECRYRSSDLQQWLGVQSGRINEYAKHANVQSPPSNGKALNFTWNEEDIIKILKASTRIGGKRTRENASKVLSEKFGVKNE